MVKSFKHKGLKKFYETGSKQGVKPEHATRLRLILARLSARSWIASHEVLAEEILVRFSARQLACHFSL